MNEYLKWNVLLYI